ncbi:uncharacterized protein EI90DRAFT_3075528 [Cantharellus anzutake]|uniref:uncharacterized protein n=1 Tax=Cantharellus anzutake TaxID=1750568 RepID=UPI0019045DF9|nr:uncharacterized protein EI90DRAFT_3075528 [Cantharellus anzutake]KAF8324481.1 hypothetical protein EI90DRAFT_3075528 [Cantharellus anzutake]
MGHPFHSAGHSFGHYRTQPLPQTLEKRDLRDADALKPHPLRLAIHSLSQRAQMEWKRQQRGLDMIALIETELYSSCNNKERKSQKERIPSFSSCLEEVIREEAAVHTASGPLEMMASASLCLSPLPEAANHLVCDSTVDILHVLADDANKQEQRTRVQTIPRIKVTLADANFRTNELAELPDENNNWERRRHLLKILRRSKRLSPVDSKYSDHRDFTQGADRRSARNEYTQV